MAQHEYEMTIECGRPEIVEWEDEMLIRVPILADGFEVGDVILSSEDR